MAAKLITQKEYARQIGKTPQYVNKLVGQGKIVLVRGLVNPTQADRAIAATASRAGRAVPRSTKKVAPPARPRGRRAVAPAERRTQSATGTLTAHRAKREEYEAKIKQLEYETRMRELLPAKEVLEAERRKNANIRTTFRKLARDLAEVLARATSPAEVERLLRVEIDLRLEDLAADPLGAAEEAKASAIEAVPAELVQTSAPAPAAEQLTSL